MSAQSQHHILHTVFAGILAKQKVQFPQLALLAASLFQDRQYKLNTTQGKALVGPLAAVVSYNNM